MPVSKEYAKAAIPVKSVKLSSRLDWWYAFIAKSGGRRFQLDFKRDGQIATNDSSYSPEEILEFAEALIEMVKNPCLR